MAITEKTYEVDNTTGVNHERAEANEPVERLTATSIISSTVKNAAGDNLGTIDNLMINLNNGTVEYVVLEFGSFLGMGGKLFAIPFGQIRLDEQLKVFILNRDKESLKDAPGFDKTHWPDTNDHNYFADVNTYYGVMPPFP
jgi:sporulation protein YlmC with PRC-barrel domain